MAVRPAAVAIIGLACRFPDAETPAEFWRLLRDGREASQLPYEAAEFDADFFHVSPAKPVSWIRANAWHWN